MRNMGKRLRTVAATIAGAATVLVAGFAAAPAALADGPDTPPQVKSEIEALAWPELKQGDQRWEVTVAEFLLVEYGYLDVTEVDDVFDKRLVAAVKEYQKDKDLSEAGTIGPETWEHLRLDFGTIGPGDSGLRTKAVQTALINHGHDLVLDGQYGQKTEEAVVAYQESVGIDADGYVGPITFRALVCGGV